MIAVCKSVATVLVFAASLLAGSSAQAFFVDFTSAIWNTRHSGDEDWSRTRTIGGVDVTVTAFDGPDANDTASLKFFTPFDGGVCPAGSGLACKNDGAGIGDDEVSFGTAGSSTLERLVVTFSAPVAIKGLHFLDLFKPSAPGDGSPEVAQWRVSGGVAGSVIADQTNNSLGGYRFASVDYTGVEQIEFFTDSDGSPVNSDFALGAIGVVPLPTAAWLFGSALLVLAGWNSRKRRGRV